MELIEKAIYFLIENYKKTGFNKKPVVLHSLKVGFALINEDKEVVASAILHDLLEDSGVTFDGIKEEFGEEIALNVLSLSEDKNIADYKERYIEMFKRTEKRGRDALLIKTMDIYDNSFYVFLEEDKEKQELFLQKMEYFLNILKEGEYYDLLKERYDAIKNEIL